jgi:hypothetical protein
LESFWADVEKAKLGEFVLPESTRKKKDVVCQIVDESDETIPVEQEVCLISED